MFSPCSSPARWMLCMFQAAWASTRMPDQPLRWSQLQVPRAIMTSPIISRIAKRSALWSTKDLRGWGHVVVRVHPCTCVLGDLLSSGYRDHRDTQARTGIDWSMEATQVSVESYCWLLDQTCFMPGLWQCHYLVGGLEHFFSHILGIIIPIDSYFSEGWPNHQPVTSYCTCSISLRKYRIWM